MEPAFPPLHGQAALVTGAGRGIGRAIAQRLAGLGATVLCVSRTQSELDETVRLAGPRAFALALDVSAPDAADRMLTGLQASAGKLDILVHCAALVGTTQQNVSKHLNLLQHAGIVARRKQGNFA